MRLIVQEVAAVGNDVILVLIWLDLDTVDGLLEEVDGRRRVERKALRSDCGWQAGVELIECEYDFDGTRLNPGENVVDANQAAAEELAREGEIFTQQVEAFEYTAVAGKQRVLGVETDLLQTFGGCLENNGIAEGIVIAKIDAPAMGEQQFIQRDSVGFGT